MANKHEGMPHWHLKRKMIAAALVAAAILTAFFVGMLRGGRETAPVITADLLGQQLQEVSELVTVEYHYTNMGKFENTLDFYGWQVPFTTKSFIVSYDGVIRAGVDLAAAEIQTEGRQVTVVLPPARILSNEILEDSLEVYDETRNIFNPITISDYTGFTRDQKQNLERKAVDNGLLTAGQERAEHAVRDLLAMLPGMEDYTVTVKSAEA